MYRQMLCTPFAGRNLFFDAKTKLYVLLGHVLHDFVRVSFNFLVYFVPLVTEKIDLASESLFQPANGVQSPKFFIFS